MDPALPVPPDVTRAKEMVDAFWSVVTLNNYWVAAFGVPSSIPRDVSIRTPWPTVIVFHSSILALDIECIF